MKKSIFAALSLLLTIALLMMPLVVSASTAVEEVFDPVTTQWYSVDYVRTSAAEASDDAFVYTWTPSADGIFTLDPDTACKDALVTLKEGSKNVLALKYYPAGGFTSSDEVTANVKGGKEYTVSVMTASEKSGTVDFFAYFNASSASGLDGAGTETDPYVIGDKVKNLPTMEAGKTFYYLLPCDKTLVYDLLIKSTNTKDVFDLYVENNKSTASSVNGSAKVEVITPFAASGYIMFSITNKNTGVGGTYTFTATQSKNLDSKGTLDDPAPLNFDTTIDAKITSVCYYFTYTAAEDGTLSVKVNTKDNWVCSISGGAAESRYCQASDKPQVNPIEYPMTAGEEVSLWVATEEFGAGTVSFVASFVTEEETTTEATVVTVPEEIPTVTTEPEEKPTNITEPIETTVAPDVDTTESTDATEATDPSEPEFSTPVATEVPDDTDPEGAFEELYDDYCLSVDPVVMGDNDIITSNVYPVTLYIFTPEEPAQYKFTASDANALVGAYAGTTNYVLPAARGTSNEFTIDFTAGSEIIIGVTGTSSCTLTIEKAGNVVVEEELPWTVYENVVDVAPIETDVNIKDLTSVFIYDEVANTAVLGDDGYYHLDSADGEVLYVDLNSKMMSFVKIVDTGKLCAVFYDENGNVSEKIDFTQAVLEYINNAAQIVNGEDTFYFYPLTADLIEMYQVVGEASDWYGRTGWVGGIAEDAWMFACHYEEGSSGIVIPKPPVNPGNPSAVPTGQSSIIVFVALAMMLSASLVIVVSRKKAHR